MVDISVRIFLAH